MFVKENQGKVRKQQIGHIPRLELVDFLLAFLYF